MERKDTFDGINNPTIYIPRMCDLGAAAVAASFRSIGFKSVPSPESDETTLELGGKFISGEECYPQKITLGDFMKLLEIQKLDPKTVAFFMPTADGPCRFGQYAPYMKKLLREKGYGDAKIISLSSEDSYKGVGSRAKELARTLWRGFVCTDILRKLILKTRPYELNQGDTARVNKECLDDICRVIEIDGISHKERLKQLVEIMKTVRNKFRAIPARYTRDRPLIGAVGEIFCRLNTFSNDNLIRKVEDMGGEVWLLGMCEWLYYINTELYIKLRLAGKKFSKDMLAAKIKNWVQKRDDYLLMNPFKEDFEGYEEAHDINTVLDYSRPYLPQEGALGEMVLSTGGAIYLYNQGADGIIDISPFTCMNGITCEAIFPSVSNDHDNIPIRNFYFDGTDQDLGQDLGIFLEVARTYGKRKKKKRRYPVFFQ